LIATSSRSRSIRRSPTRCARRPARREADRLPDRVPPPGLTIRPEAPADFAAIDRFQLAAFDDPQLPPLIAAIRASANYLPDLALVAELGGEVVGQIMVSRLTLVTERGDQVPILVLSPLGVAPPVQNRGIGEALTRASLAIADRRAEPVMVVQGHPTYYPRFGFERGRTIGILPPEHLGAIDKAWMARRRPGASTEVVGRVEYPAYFRDLD
jgi:putative acetyltransferase